MKLIIEIDAKQLRYDYEIGTSKAHSEMPLNTDGFVLFASFLVQIREWEKFQIQMRRSATQGGKASG